MSIFKKITLIFSAFVLAILNSISVYAVGFDEEFYSSNDILFYDPRAQECTESIDTSVTEGNDNAEKVFNFLISTPLSTNDNKPMNAVQAAAMIGNFRQESGLDPKKENSIGAFGIAQWLGGRKTNLFKLDQPESLTTQLKFVVQELVGDEKAIMSHGDFRDAADLEKATIAVRKTYERPGEAEANDANRIKRASEALDQFRGNVPSSTVLSDGSGICLGTDPSQFVTDDGFIVYNQEDPKWAGKLFGSKTIKSSGCGPTSMATIITALTGQSITPDKTTEYANKYNLYVEGQGASHSLPAVLAPNWNLKANRVAKSVTSINTKLRQGALIIMAGTGSAPYTAAGHYITIRGVTASGAWKIADSNGQIGQLNSTKEWSPEDILVKTSGGSIYAVEK